MDPDNRLVAGELEARWNAALARTVQVEKKLQELDTRTETEVLPDKQTLLRLAQDLPEVWNAASTPMRLKQRIVHLLIREIVADVDREHQQIVLVLHWTGGRHSELRLKRPASGENRRRAGEEILEAVRQMAPRYSDEQIAMTLNRLGLRTGAGNGWSGARVHSFRCYHQLPAYEAVPSESTTMTLQQAAEQLGVSSTTVRRLIRNQQLAAKQVIAGGPWEVPVEALRNAHVQRKVEKIKSQVGPPQTQNDLRQELLFSDS